MYDLSIGAYYRGIEEDYNRYESSDWFKWEDWHYIDWEIYNEAVSKWMKNLERKDGELVLPTKIEKPTHKQKRDSWQRMTVEQRIKHVKEDWVKEIFEKEGQQDLYPKALIKYEK